MFNVLSGLGALVNPASAIASTLIGEIFGGDEEQAATQPATYTRAAAPPQVVVAAPPPPPPPDAMDAYLSGAFYPPAPPPLSFANGGEVMHPPIPPREQSMWSSFADGGEVQAPQSWWFGAVNPAWQPLAGSLNNWLAGGLSGPDAPGVSIPGFTPGVRLPGYAEGGEVEGEEISDEAIVEMAMQAISGASENPDEVIAEFVSRFGEQALADLASRARGAQQPTQSDGKSDSIPAVINGVQPARLSEGEFVMPADVVSGIGNGSTDAGVRRLKEMIAKVRAVKSKDMK